MLNAPQWKTLVNEESIRARAPPVYSDEDIQANKVDTDWLEEVFRVAPDIQFLYFVHRCNREGKILCQWQLLQAGGHHHRKSL